MHLRQQYQMLNSKRIRIKFWIKVWRVWPCEGLRTECHYVRWDYVFILLCLFIISWGGRGADKGDLSRSRSQAGEGVPETLLEMCGDQTCEPCLTMFECCEGWASSSVSMFGGDTGDTALLCPGRSPWLITAGSGARGSSIYLRMFSWFNMEYWDLFGEQTNMSSTLEGAVTS